MPTQLKYPQAAAEAAKYHAAELSLLGKMKNIEDAINIVIGEDTLLNGAVLGGAYYDRYRSAAQKWVELVHNRQAEFSSFYGELQTCLSQVVAQKNMWIARQTETEEVSTGGK